MFPLYFIANYNPALLDTVAQAMAGGARLIQYRDKQNTRRAVYENALRLREMTADPGVTLIINDHLDIARAVGADGVHLGQTDLPLSAARQMLGEKGIVGISTHTLSEAVRAEQEGATYIGVGPIFTTHSKENASAPVGKALITEIKKTVRIPLYAIGGIDVAHLSEILHAGADGVAAISAFSGDVRANVAQWIETIEQHPRFGGQGRFSAPSL